MNSTFNNITDNIPAHRKSEKFGTVADFTVCNEDYLMLISNDLELGATIEQMRALQNVFISLGRNPLVSELYFSFAVLLCKEKNAFENITIDKAENCPEDLRILLADFVRRYCTEQSNYDKELRISDLMVFASTGKVIQEPCGIDICKTNNPVFPTLYSGKSERIVIDDYIITFSSGKPIGGNKDGDIFVLISPDNVSDIDTFINKTTQICQRFVSEHPNTKLIPASDKGILLDMLEHSDGLIMDTSLLPQPSQLPESVLLAANPAMIVHTQRENLPLLWRIAHEYGIVPCAPAATRAKYVSVRSPRETLEYEKGFFNLFNCVTKVSVKNSDEAYIVSNGTQLTKDKAEYNISLSPHTLEVYHPGGSDLYGELYDCMNDTESVYAIAGTLNPNDGLFIKTLITVDSFRRNVQPNIITSHFFIGNETSITVLKLKNKK